MGANISVCFLNSSTPEFSLSLDGHQCEKVVTGNKDNTPLISKDLVAYKRIEIETEIAEPSNEGDQIYEEQSDSEQSVLAEACVSPTTSSRRSSPCRFPSPRDVKFESIHSPLLDRESEIMKRFQNHDFNEIKDLSIDFIDVGQPKVNELATDLEATYPLHAAVLQGDVSMIQQLLNDGAYLHVKDQDGKTPIANAFALGNIEIIDILVAAKDAEFQHSPYSPYAPSCATRSSSGSICGANERGFLHIPHGGGGSSSDDFGNIVASRNSSFRSVSSATFELHRHSRDIPYNGMHSLGSEEPVKMDSVVQHETTNPRSSCSNTDTDVITAEREGAVAITPTELEPVIGVLLPHSTSTTTINTDTSSPPMPSLTRQKFKKPLVNRLQKAAGKMFSYVRPPRHHGSVSSSSQSYSSENESPSNKTSLSLSSDI